MNGVMNEWMNEVTNEWSNEWINERKHPGCAIDWLTSLAPITYLLRLEDLLKAAAADLSHADGGASAEVCRRHTCTRAHTHACTHTHTHTHRERERERGRETDTETDIDSHTMSGDIVSRPKASSDATAYRVNLTRAQDLPLFSYYLIFFGRAGGDVHGQS